MVAIKHANAHDLTKPSLPFAAPRTQSGGFDLDFAQISVPRVVRVEHSGRFCLFFIHP